MKLCKLLQNIAEYQLIAVSATTTLNDYDFLGSANIALNGGIAEAFKNISVSPLEMNVVKIDVRTGLLDYTDEKANLIDTPVIYIIVN